MKTALLFRSMVLGMVALAAVACEETSESSYHVVSVTVEYRNTGPNSVHMGLGQTVSLADVIRVDPSGTSTRSEKMFFDGQHETDFTFTVARPEGVLDRDTLQWDSLEATGTQKVIVTWDGSNLTTLVVPAE